jgi:acetyl-CoA acetyltransferase family protein
MSDLFIIAGLRTPFIRMGTDFDGLSAADLGNHACGALLTRTGIDPAMLSEVIFGCVAQPYDSANVARVIALRAGVPEHVPAATVHRNCASGMEAITTAHQRMVAGQGDLFLVGGTESMSGVPLFYPHATNAKFNALGRAKGVKDKLRAIASFRPADFKPEIGLQLGLTDPYSGMIMGDTAELLSREYGIDRTMQDAFADSSHRKALAAREQVRQEIAPVFINGHAVSADNGIREDSTIVKLAKLKPIFDRQTGTVTAGNSSQITDGAVALLVGSAEAATRLGIEPVGRLVSYAYAGCDPSRMGLGPVPAMVLAKERHGLSPSEADVIEINEAFAAQVLAVLAELRKKGAGYEIPEEKINRWGGSIALGHPVGATGARLVLTALHQLHVTGGRRALVTLCVGGGQGAALWLERP